MANKDLNLSLDSNLRQTQPTVTSTINTKNSKPGIIPRILTSISSAAISLPKAAFTGMLFLLLTNLAFLFWAGLWLTEQRQTSTTMNSTNNGLSTTAAAELQQITTQLDDLRQQFNQLNVRLAEQKLLFTISHHEITDKFDSQSKNIASIAIQRPPKTLATTISAVLSPAKIKSESHWFVNLGTFSNKTAAQRLQKQIKALGYDPVITQLTLDKKIAYRVQIPDFFDRKAAEKVAGKIMQQTNLNGLWAWKEQ